MISAKEAKEESYKKTVYIVSDELRSVEEEIKNAINNGKYSVYYNGSLYQETVDHLRVLGYKVEYGSQYNESYYMISW